MREISVEDIVGAIHRARSDPHSAEVVALQLAVEEIHRQSRALGEEVELLPHEHVDVSHAVSGGADWEDLANNHVEFDELQRRRATLVPLPRPEADPQLVEAFQRAEAEQESRREAWQRDDEAQADSGQAVAR